VIFIDIHMMDSSRILFLCLTAIGFYFFSQYSNSSLNVVTRPPRKLSMLLPNQKREYHKSKVADEAMKLKRTKEKEGSMALQYAKSADKLNNLVYTLITME
ncbi:putative Transmembrane protein, partial [Quillaja saponaria]